MCGCGVGGGCKKVRSTRSGSTPRKGEIPMHVPPAGPSSKFGFRLAEALKTEARCCNSVSIQTTASHRLQQTTMAAIRAPSAAFLSAFLPVARAQLFPAATQPITKRIPLLQRLRASAYLLPAALTPIPSLLSELWDGILNAVPKKKTSHMKKRHRQMAAGKHLKDVTALNTCSACGRAKRAHVLCPYCVQSEYTCYSAGHLYDAC